MSHHPPMTSPESELRRIRSLIADLDAVVWEADARTMRFTFVSQGAADLLGYTPREWLADPTFWADHIHPEDRERAIAQFVRAATAGWSFDTEYRFIAGDGRVLWLRDLGHAVKDSDGEPTLVRGLMVDVTRHNVLEGERRDAEERFRRVVERLPAIVYIEAIEEDPGVPGSLLYVSPQVEPILGFSPEEWMSAPKTWTRQIHPEDRELFRRGLSRPGGTGETLSADYRILGRDGRVVFVHDEAVLVLHQDGRPLYRQGIMYDVTRQRESEERAKETEARYRALVEQLPAIVYSESVIGGELQLVYVNPRVNEILGIDPAEWVADPENAWLGNIHPDDRPAVEQIRASRKTGHPFHAEYRMHARDGRTVWLRDEAVLVRDELGDPKYWQGVMTDVTALKEAEAQLAEAEARYRALVEQTPTITYIDAVEGPQATLYISPQTTSILGYTPQDWYDEPDLFDKIAHADVLEHPRHADLSVGVHDATYRVTTKDGRDVWLHDQARLIRDEEANPIYWQGVLVDVTEHRLAEELAHDLTLERDTAQRLRDIDEMKNTFLQAVSHDLRTPLAAILGLAVTMTRRDLELEPDETRDMARRIAQNAQRLDRLVTDLLDLDRLTRGIVEPVFRQTDVGALVRDLVESAEVLADREVYLKTSPIVIPVDAPKVERIVENLLGNAVKHTPPDTRIWVRATEWEDGALIIVDDEGPGVPPEIRDRIFEPFQQAATEPESSPGVGVGLALVARFAELHDGGAWVEERAGGGASFRVFLPGNPAGYRSGGPGGADESWFDDGGGFEDDVETDDDDRSNGAGSSSSEASQA
jgi:PAS domain S-box-containing protein